MDIVQIDHTTGTWLYLYVRNVYMYVCMCVCIYLCIMYVCLHNTKREDQQDSTIRCLLLTSVSTCFGHHYAHLQENKGPVTAFGVFGVYFRMRALLALYYSHKYKHVYTL